MKMNSGTLMRGCWRLQNQWTLEDRPWNIDRSQGTLWLSRRQIAEGKHSSFGREPDCTIHQYPHHWRWTAQQLRVNPKPHSSRQLCWVLRAGEREDSPQPLRLSSWVWAASSHGVSCHIRRPFAGWLIRINTCPPMSYLFGCPTSTQNICF